jgi:hypothetical protein
MPLAAAPGGEPEGDLPAVRMSANLPRVVLLTETKLPLYVSGAGLRV